MNSRTANAWPFGAGKQQGITLPGLQDLPSGCDQFPFLVAVLVARQ